MGFLLVKDFDNSFVGIHKVITSQKTWFVASVWDRKNKTGSQYKAKVIHHNEGPIAKREWLSLIKDSNKNKYYSECVTIIKEKLPEFANIGERVGAEIHFSMVDFMPIFDTLNISK